MSPVVTRQHCGRLAALSVAEFHSPPGSVIERRNETIVFRSSDVGSAIVVLRSAAVGPVSLSPVVRRLSIAAVPRDDTWLSVDLIAVMHTLQ